MKKDVPRIQEHKKLKLHHFNAFISDAILG